MKYRKTFREALNDMGKKDKPEAKPEAPVEKSVENQDSDEVRKLKDEIAELEKFTTQLTSTKNFKAKKNMVLEMKKE